MTNWFAPTHHDWLVANAGLDPSVVPLVDCACGTKARPASYMVDVTGLPDAVRAALGISGVDYLCDGCISRLFREQYIAQEDFNRLLGAPPDNLARVRAFDQEHANGLAARSANDRPRFAPVTITAPLKGGALRLSGVATVVLSAGEVAPTLPLRTRSLTHADSVAKLIRQGAVPNPNPPPLPNLTAGSKS